ncbi:hypothetical protein K1X84_14270 [bacterium]|nr:hypothetical protein [bacterium]
MEERHSLIDHPNSFKTQGLKEFADDVQNYIDKSIMRNGSELDTLKQIVTSYKGQKVALVTPPSKSGNYNWNTVEIIDWNDVKNSGVEIYQQFNESDFTTDYIPFAYRKNEEDEEELFLCEKLDTPSPWIRVYGNESSDTWVGHYFGNSIRNCAIIASDKISAWQGSMSNEEAQRILDEQSDQLKAQMNANIQNVQASGELSPVEGVSLEDWALANAKIINGTGVNEILKILKIEQPQWDRINAEWNARMARDTTFAIATVYGQAFANAGQGQFGGNAKTAASR